MIGSPPERESLFWQKGQGITSPFMSSENSTLVLHSRHSRINTLLGTARTTLQSVQLIVCPAPASSITRCFPHDPHLKKMSGILISPEEYPAGLQMTTEKTPPSPTRIPPPVPQNAPHLDMNLPESRAPLPPHAVWENSTKLAHIMLISGG